MSSLFSVSLAAALALHALSLVARSDAPVPTKRISAALSASEAHLSKVLRRLVTAGLLRAKRGPGGGFELARAAAEIRLRDIYEAIEGPLGPAACPFGVPVCDGGACMLGDQFRNAGDTLFQFLSNARLSDYQNSKCLGEGSENENVP